MIYSGVESSNRSEEWKAMIPGEEQRSVLGLQRIFFGAPGSGKLNIVKKRTELAEKDERVYRTTFHPDSDYSTFVGAYKPAMKHSEGKYSISELSIKLKEIKDTGVTYPCHKFATKYWESIKDLSPEAVKQLLSENGFTESMATEVSKGISIGQYCLKNDKEGTIKYSFVPQVFVKAYVDAWSKTEDVYLIIEEINRGNCAQIFGDLFQLLDRNNGYSEYPIDADMDLADYLHMELSQSTRTDFPEGVKEGKKLALPNNMYIWATMNTSDQSLFPMDSAFKRRWSWEYVPIQYDEPKSAAFKLIIDGTPYEKWVDFLKQVNRIILEKTDSEDKQMGNFFIKGDINEQDFKDKVMFYLWSEVCKDSFHTKDNFFRTKDKEFSYNELYGDEGHALLVGFLEYINNYKTKDNQKA